MERVNNVPWWANKQLTEPEIILKRFYINGKLFHEEIEYQSKEDTIEYAIDYIRTLKQDIHK